jgi:ribulose 1,5-bisphosphate carboxylase large subunit-like protein
MIGMVAKSITIVRADDTRTRLNVAICDRVTHITQNDSRVYKIQANIVITNMNVEGLPVCHTLRYRK